MTLDQTIETIGIVVTFFTGVVAIIISMKTLKQNSVMIEESTRPNLSIYFGTTYFSSVTEYLIIKNFGFSAATVESLTTDFDLSLLGIDKKHPPFKEIEGTNLAPEEKILYPINLQNLPGDKAPHIKINIRYRSETKTYTSSFDIDLSAHYHVTHIRANTRDQHIKEISFALQDISEKML